MPVLIEPTSQACSGCRRTFQPHELGRMWQLPVRLLRPLGKGIGSEAEKLYCRRCRWTQSTGAVVLVVLGAIALILKLLD